ncbi:MAG: hypothetical protein COT26_00455 [Candidatus Kerfeldbacteria bacterium CG08_land_8_20_14_0_20_43_14]|uniref:Uncharacterized protein n=1 Tax=Candidatus Kerfeldbacteria bacterium CG08_land_8_20_14_0_20_43_14 TaxID=2014246 RepID=A0A2H0YR53_9BACT|nr:MAG: hypothetical protein COT26_00455 [Candidatus Kerfeldbacteria bacterium CG08_land_8_20_14_0_20_43_14]
MKKIVISASSSFYKEALVCKNRFEKNGHKILAYPKKIVKGQRLNYKIVHKTFYQAITKTNVLFVLNLKKKGIPNYIGPSVFAEIAFAIGLNLTFNKHIKIYCLNPLPKNLPYSEELIKWQKLGWIKAKGDWKISRLAS